MPLVHECAAPNCQVVTMGAFCIEHERESFALGGAALRKPISNAAVQSRAGGMPPFRDSHRIPTKRPLRALPISPRLAARPR
jgi:hypothetical protein